MSIVELEDLITKLPRAEITALRAWLDDYDDDLWDKQMAEDADSGKLDAILERATRDSEAGLGTPL